MKNRKRLILFVSIAVVVIGGAVAAALYFSRQSAQNNGAQTDETSENEVSRHPAELEADDAVKKAYEGSAEEGAKALDEKIAATEDTFSQYIFYSEKATLLLNDKKYDAALEAALKAYELQKTSDSAAFVAQIAEEKGDVTLALDYYKRAVELIDPDSNPLAKSDTRYYENAIKRLEGTR